MLRILELKRSQFDEDPANKADGRGKLIVLRTE